MHRHICGVITFLFAVGGTLGAAQYEVEGDLVYTIFTPDETPQKQTEIHYTVAVQDCLWFIRTVRKTADPSFNVASRYEAGTDGTNTYQWTLFNTNFVTGAAISNRLEIIDRKGATGGIESTVNSSSAREREQLQKHLDIQQRRLANTRTNAAKLSPRNKASAKIIPGTVPGYSGDFAKTIWMAYASQCYLDGVTNDRLTQVWEFDNTRSPLHSNSLYKAQWRRSQEAPFLPTEIRFLNEGIYHPDNPKLDAIIFAAPYDRGFTNAMFTVTAVTNHNGMTLPLSWKIVRYGVQSSPGKAELKILTTVEGFTRRIQSELGISQFIPQLTVPTAVQDSRFMAQPIPHSPQYHVAGGNWPSVDEVRQMKAYQADVLRVSRKAEAKAAAQKNLSAVVIFLVILALPFYLLFSKFRKPRQE